MYEVYSKLLNGGNIGDFVGDPYRAVKGMLGV